MRKGTISKNATKNARSNSISKPIIPSSKGFSVHFHYQWINGTDELLKKHKFTNLCENKEKFADEMIYIMNTVIPKLYSDGEEIFKPGSNKSINTHCHTITGDKLKLAIEIANKIHKRTFDSFEGEDISWWQVGWSKGIRLIGLYNKVEKDFFPLFIDRHHLIFSSEKHNKTDYKNCKFNPGK